MIRSIKGHGRVLCEEEGMQQLKKEVVSSRVNDFEKSDSF